MKKDKEFKCGAASGGAGGALYFVGFIGALVYFWQQASNGIWDYVIAIFQAIFWPAFAVYELLKFLEVGLL